jgi:hypothetical protein
VGGNHAHAAQAKALDERHIPRATNATIIALTAVVSDDGSTMLVSKLLRATRLSEDTHCRRCGARIARGDAVLVQRTATPYALDPRGVSRAFHPRCAVDLAPLVARTALQQAKAPDAPDDHDSLVALATERLTARRPDSAAEPAVEPARDPLGRPRCWVLFLCSPPDPSPQSPDAPLYDAEHALVDATLRSSVREYVLRVHERTRDTERDPAQPTVAGLFWHRTDVKVSHQHRRKLVQWRALELTAPALVVVGPGADDPAVRDPIVRTLRTLLEGAGFEGDDAPVVAGTRVTTALLDELALALDSRVTAAKNDGRASRVERSLALLDEILANERTDALESALKNLAGHHSTATDADRRRIGMSMLRAATTPKTAAMVVKQLAQITFPFAELPREQLAPVATQLLESRGRVPSALGQLMRLSRLGYGDERPLVDVLLSFTTSPLGEKAFAASYALETHGGATALQALREAIDRESDPARAAKLKALLERCERAPARG